MRGAFLSSVPGLLGAGLISAAAVSFAGAAGAMEVPPNETPVLAHAVAAGDLPPIHKRLPDPPSVALMGGNGKEPGRHGGEMRVLMGKAKDVRMMVIYGYARLVAYDENLDIQPDIVARYEVEEGRRFTFHLRKNHRWSDGHPFTAEDIRYYWEDVANNEDLSPFGHRKTYLVDGRPPTFEVIDAHTVRYTWEKPNPYFLPGLAGAAPLISYLPAHYMKTFHLRYTAPEKVQAMVKAASLPDWAALHDSKARRYRFDNPDLPTLQPWVNTTRPPSEHFVFKRNPYYHRVDPEGRQLPYIDSVAMHMGSTKIIPAKAGSGAADLQARYLRFDNYTFLKAGEKRNGYRVRLWHTAKGAQMALYPNLNTTDPVWREVMRDRRFRRALSMGINRHQINQVVYFGLAHASNNTLLPKSPLYKPGYAKAWTQFDPAHANRLLDEMGLSARDDDGLRLLPDGRPVVIIVDTAGESTEQTDVLELIGGTWREIGVKLFTRPSQREVFRKRIFSGQAMMSVWSGITNGVARADMSPQEFAPTSRYQLQWPLWGQFSETGGKSGQRPDMPAALELLRLNEQWRLATETDARTRIWHKMLKLHSDEALTLGVVNQTLQPVVINERLRNVPDKGFYNWDPGAYFGIYRPDTFWFAKG